MSEDTTLADLLQLDLHKYEDEVRNIVDKAVKESGMEKVRAVDGDVCPARGDAPPTLWLSLPMGPVLVYTWKFPGLSRTQPTTVLLQKSPGIYCHSCHPAHGTPGTLRSLRGVPCPCPLCLAPCPGPSSPHGSGSARGHVAAFCCVLGQPR